MNRSLPPSTGFQNLVSATLVALALLSAGAVCGQDDGTGKQPPGTDKAKAAAGMEATPDSTPATPAATPKKKETSPDTEALQQEVNGYLKQTFRLRHAGSSTDLDSYTDFYVDYSRGGDHPLGVRLNGRMVADLAGNQQPGDPLRDIWDGFSNDVQVRLYEAYAQVGNLLGEPIQIRAGRQFLDEGTYLQFDGGRVDFGPKAKWKSFEATAFGGVPVRFGDPDRDGNWLAGLILRLKLDDKTRIRVGYVHVTESFPGINYPVTDPNFQPISIPPTHFDDDLLGLSAWRKIRDNLHLFGRFSLLNGDPNELHLRGRWFTKDGKWLVVAEYYEVFGRLEQVTNELTPFVPMLGTLQPYWRFGLRVTRRFGDDWIVQGGYSHRSLIHTSDEGPFNHTFNHYFASVTRANLLDRKLDAVFVGTGYTSDRNDVGAVGGSLDYRPNKKTMLSAGVDYSLYKYDFIRNAEEENVYDYWIRARYKLTKKTILRGQFSIDDTRYTTYFTFLVSVEVHF